MKRRQFVTATLAAAGYTALAGCSNEPAEAQDGDFPSHDRPAYSAWVPATPYESSAANDTGEGVFFVHVDWEDINALESQSQSESEGNATDSEQVVGSDIGNIMAASPLIGTSLYGSIVTPAALLGIMYYPFANAVLPADESEAVDGITTRELTWVSNTVTFHGEYNPAVFNEQFSEGFERVEERDGFTVYHGTQGFIEGLSYAVSEDTLIAATHPEGSGTHDPVVVVGDALDRNLNKVDRVVDTDDGTWLFETTGDAPVIFGVWETGALAPALNTEASGNESMSTANNTTESAPNPAAVIEGNPVFDTVESLVSNMHFEVDGSEMSNIKARFAALYPDGTTPTEDEVREHLIRAEDVSQEITIDGNRLYATATFENGVPTRHADE